MGNIVARLYDAATGDATWEDVLAQIALAAGGSYAVCQQFNAETGAVTHLELGGVLDSPESAGRDYAEHYAPIDPRVAYVLDHPYEALYHDYAILTDAEMDRHEVYDFLATTGVRYFSGTSLGAIASGCGQAGIGVLSCNRTRLQGPSDEADQRLLLALRPHVRQALQIEARLAGLEAQRDLLADALEGVPNGIAIVASDAAVAWMNREARRLLTSFGGLAVIGGKLSAEEPESKRRLQYLIGAACRSLTEPSIPPGGSMRVPCREGGPLDVIVAPVPDDWAGSARLVLRKRPYALVFVHDASRRKQPLPEVLQSLYELTPGEARIAAALAGGARLVDLGDRFCLAQDTVRFYCKQVFLKTGTNSQSQLVSLLLRNPAVLALAESADERE